MLMVNHCTYIEDRSAIAAIRPTHREYIAKLSTEGKIVGAGPLGDGIGGLFIYSVNNEEEAQKLVHQDPYFIMGILANWTLAVWRPVNTTPQLLAIE